MSTLTLVRLTAAEAVVPATRTRPKANGAARAARRAALARTLLSTLVTIGVTAGRRPGPGAPRPPATCQGARRKSWTEPRGTNPADSSARTLAALPGATAATA